MNKIVNFFLFFILILVLSFFAQMFDLIIEFTLLIYAVTFGWAIYKKNWKGLQNRVFVVLEICILRYILGVTGLWVILIVIILPSLRNAKLVKLWTTTKFLYIMYMRIIDDISESIYKKYIKKKS